MAFDFIESFQWRTVGGGVWGFKSQIATHHVTRNDTPIHNILSTAPQLSITFAEDGNVMPKHEGATIYN
jgi:hypothetical protein